MTSGRSTAWHVPEGDAARRYMYAARDGWNGVPTEVAMVRMRHPSALRMERVSGCASQPGQLTVRFCGPCYS